MSLEGATGGTEVFFWGTSGFPLPMPSPVGKKWKPCGQEDGTGEDSETELHLPSLPGGAIVKIGSVPRKSMCNILLQLDTIEM